MNNKMFLLLLVVSTMIFSCSKDEVSEDLEVSEVNLLIKESKNTREESRIQEITHNYNYYEDRFSVIYTFDNETDEIIDVSGDVERAEQLFANEESGPNEFLYEDYEENDTTINIRLFNTTEELNDYAGISQEVNSTNRVACVDVDNNNNYGSDFYYYQHKNYGVEMIGMRRTFKSYYQDTWVGSAYNDQLTSFIAFRRPGFRRVFVGLRQHACFGGKNATFISTNTIMAVPNLKHLYTGPWWWSRSWNDYVSSTYGGADTAL